MYMNLTWPSFFCYTYILYSLFFFVYFMKNCDRKHFFWVNIKTVFSSFISILNIAVSKQKFFISTTQRPWNDFEFRAAAKAQNQYLNLFLVQLDACVHVWFWIRFFQIFSVYMKAYYLCCRFKMWWGQAFGLGVISQWPNQLILVSFYYFDSSRAPRGF